MYRQSGQIWVAARRRRYHGRYHAHKPCREVDGEAVPRLNGSAPRSGGGAAMFGTRKTMWCSVSGDDASSIGREGGGGGQD
jgi:hypothetical protein